MASLINEQKYLQDAAFTYEKRLTSPINKFLDSTPTYVTYYHINADVTTTDAGFLDVESILGSHSPLRFNKIVNFPLYINDPIQINLEESDQGLDTNYESEAIVLPGTIRPLHNSFFTINTLGTKPFLFRVTTVSQDTVINDGFYKIGYKLEAIDTGEITKLEAQVVAKFEYIQRTIGSDERCIIESEYADELENIKKMMYDMMDMYSKIFYNERYNCFLGELGAHQKLYDPLMTEFINKHNLFNVKESTKVMILTDHYSNDNHRQIKYEKSVYRFMERRDKSYAKNFKFDIFSGLEIKNSAFARWHDDSVYVLDIPAILSPNAINIFSDEFINAIKYNTFTESKHADLIVRFIRGEEITLASVPLDLNEELINLDVSIELFFITPLIIYILKTIIEEFMSSRKTPLDNMELTVR